MTTTGWLSIEGAAEIIGVSAAEVVRACSDRRLDRIWVGRLVRVPREQVEQWRREGCPPPARPRARAPRAQPPLPTRRLGWIYFIGAAEFYPVKVGWTVRVEGRIGAIQTGSWEPLVILGALRGDAEDERAVHAELATYRCSGEWFDRGPTLALFGELAAAMDPRDVRP